MPSTPTTPPHRSAASGPRPSLLAVGDNVVDHYPQRGLFYPGGNAVNVAVHARRLGVDSAYVGTVGTDLAGRVVLEALHNEGVDLARTRIVEGPNAFAVVQVIDGNRAFTHGDLGVSDFTLTEDDLAAAAAYDIVHTGECSGVEDQLSLLARSAARLSFDFSERPWEYVQEHAPSVSIATWSSPSGDLAEATRAAERVRSLGPTTVAVTMGAHGAVVLEEDVTYAPAGSGQIVDTLGAGDAFIARLLAGLVRHESRAELAWAATEYATQACASFGAFGYATPLDSRTIPHDSTHRPDRLDVS
ncbi:MAG: PfkB family carbohydrate kinase [Actinomycetota bacterium]|nr:PfkB family carbohydrate kinase [Actinomycetota bacterium]